MNNNPFDIANEYNDQSLQIELLSEDVIMPKRGNPTDSGLDLYVPRAITIPAGKTVRVPTDIAIQLPFGHEGQIRTRSSIALEDKLEVKFGTIDFSYNGPIGIITKNLTDEPITIKQHERIAQLVIAPVSYINPIEVESVDYSNRGGFGSTGR